MGKVNFINGCLLAVLLAAALGCEQNQTKQTEQQAVQPVETKQEQAMPVEPIEPEKKIESPVTARMLSISSKPADARALIGYLSSTDPMQRRYAIYGLQFIGDKQHAPAMFRLINDPDPKVQMAAVESIGKLGHDGAVEPLTELLTAEDVLLRYQVLMALGRIGYADACPAMTEAFKDKQLWLDLPTWDAMSLFSIIAADFYDDDAVVEVLYGLLDYPDWDNPKLAGMEASRIKQLSWIIAHRAAYVLAMKYSDPAGEERLLEGFEFSDYEMQDSALALVKIKSSRALPGLTKMLDSRFHNTRRDAVIAMGELGDPQAISTLEALMGDEDVAIRKAAASALHKIDGRMIKADLSAPAADPTQAGKDIETPGGIKPPQFIVLGVDDCASIEGLESMLDICKTLDEMGSKAVFTMWVAPLSGTPDQRDVVKQTVLLQKLFNYGCEFANHTLHHNPGGKNWSASEPAVQIEEVEGCTKWLQDNIDGFQKPFTIKHGGGGKGAAYDREFTNALIAKQGYLYTGRRGPHPNEQRWPYEEKSHRGDYVIETGYMDGNAPPMHAKITNQITSDYPGRFDYDMQPGLAMWKSNFEYRYALAHRPILAVNAFHDWGLKRPESLTSGRLTHRNQAKLLKAFLIDVLVNNREKYPDTYCITFRQVMEYSLTDGDLQKTLALGNGQDGR